MIQIAEKDLALKVKHHKQCYEKYGTERYRAPEYGLIISTVLGQVDHDGQHENAARTPIWDETSETYHTRKRRFRHSAIYQTIKALVIPPPPVTALLLCHARFVRNVLKDS